MRGEPRKGALRHLNQQISELFGSSEILSSLSKRLFRQADRPRRMVGAVLRNFCVSDFSERLVLPAIFVLFYNFSLGVLKKLVRYCKILYCAGEGGRWMGESSALRDKT